MGKGGGTIGYHYLCSLLFGIGRGPVNALLKIKVGGQEAWSGIQPGDALSPINKPDLFGGEKKEGGIQGLFRSLVGTRNQVIPGAASMTIGSRGPYRNGTLPFLRSALSPGDPDDVPEFRGRHMFWYDGLVSSMNPYIKEWEFRRWRTTAGWHGYSNGQCWYQAKATVYLQGEGGEMIYAMNPAHIIYQVSTDPAMGRGMDASELDDNSFTYAANILCNEGFGLCFNWMREDDVGNFIQSVCDHAGLTMYTDRETGLVCIKAIRNDYNVNNIPHFSKTNGLVSIEEDDSASSDEFVDEVIINGKSPITNQKIQGRAHNLAVRLFRGGSTSKTVEYPGLPTVALCNRVAERDRDMSSSGLRKFKVILDRAGFRIHPGAVFKVTDPAKGLAQIVLRAGEIDDGNMTSGRITVSCTQDVFSLPETSFVEPVENTWEPPSQEALPATSEMIEASYRDLYLRVSQADLDTITESSAQYAMLALKPSLTSQTYDLIDRAEGETEWPATTPTTNFFTAGAALAGDLTATATTFIVNAPIEFPDASTLVGRAVYIGDEYMRIEAYDEETRQFTVERGCVDTWPKLHGANHRVWLIDDDIGYNDRDYLNGETVEGKALTRTTTDVLDESEAPLQSVELEGRPFRPYPPADVKVNGNTIFGPMGDDEDEPEISWVERNRVTQADVLIGYFEPTVAAEAGTTYKVEIYDLADTLIGTHDGIMASPWVYDAAMQTADGVVPGTLLNARLYAVRDGVDSLEQQHFVIRFGSALSTDGDILYEDGEFITA